MVYAFTVILYVVERRFIWLGPGPFQPGRWETPVVAGALTWLAYELIILIAPDQFRSAQRYALGRSPSAPCSALFYGLMWVIDPAGMRRRLPLPAGDASAGDEEGEDWLEDPRHLHPGERREPVGNG